MASKLTTEEAVSAFRGRFDTIEEARTVYAKVRKMYEDELDKLKGNSSADAKLKVSELKTKIAEVDRATSKLGKGKAVVGGIGTGAIDVASFIPDIGIAAANMFGADIPSLSGTVKGYLSEKGRNIPIGRALTKEEDPYFGFAQGAVQIPTRTLKGTLAQSSIYGTAGAIDTSGLSTSVLGSLQAITGIAQALKTGYGSYKAKDLISGLPEDTQSNLKAFLLKGQTSGDPKIAALIKQLKSNPETAEILSVLEKGARDQTIKGVSPLFTEGPIAVPIAKAIQQRVNALQYKITGDPVKKQFSRAKEILGDNPSIDITSTLENLNQLKAGFARQGTDSAEAAIKSIDKIQDKLMSDFQGRKIGLTTVDKLQANLSAFGKKAAGEENLLSGVTISDQERVAAAVFGGLKTDLDIAKKAGNTDIRKAALILSNARNDVSNGYAAYNKFIAQGLPEKLKNVSLDQLDDAKFTEIFKGLSADQRKSVLPIIEAQAPEAVDRLRAAYYKDFLQPAYKRLSDGTYGYDFESIVKKYNTMDDTQKELLSFSLGSNMKDFDARMKDATDFFRFNQKVQPRFESKGLAGEDISKAEAAVGAVGGYQPAKAAGVVLRAYNGLTQGLSDTDILKILLTPEGKAFLRTAKLSPTSTKTLESLNTLKGLDAAQKITGGALNISRGVNNILSTETQQTALSAEPPVQPEDALLIAPPTTQQDEEDKFVIPPPVMGQ